MYIILWIIFGALVGWIASMIMGTDQQQGGLANIVIGIMGAIIGGLIARFIGVDTGTGFSISGFIVSVLGAVILIGIVGAISGGTRSGNTP